MGLLPLYYYCDMLQNDKENLPIGEPLGEDRGVVALMEIGKYKLTKEVYTFLLAKKCLPV